MMKNMIKRKHFLILVTMTLVLGGAVATTVWAACSCTATTDLPAECSGVVRKSCGLLGCGFTVQCPPVNAYCLLGSNCVVHYWVVDPHEKCDKTGQPNLECYKNGPYYKRYYDGGDCDLIGCKAATEDEEERLGPFDNYNTRPCSS